MIATQISESPPAPSASVDAVCKALAELQATAVPALRAAVAELRVCGGDGDGSAGERKDSGEKSGSHSQTADATIAALKMEVEDGRAALRAAATREAAALAAVRRVGEGVGRMEALEARVADAEKMAADAAEREKVANEAAAAAAAAAADAEARADAAEAAAAALRAAEVGGDDAADERVLELEKKIAALESKELRAIKAAQKAKARIAELTHALAAASTHATADPPKNAKHSRKRDVAPAHATPRKRRHTLARPPDLLAARAPIAPAGPAAPPLADPTPADPSTQPRLDLDTLAFGP